MATTINSKKPVAFFPGAFNKRESKLLESGFKAVVGADQETVTLTNGDGVNFASINAAGGNATLVLPNPAQCPNRCVFVRVEDSTAAALIEQADGTDVEADAAAGSYAYMSTGSAWVRVF